MKNEKQKVVVIGEVSRLNGADMKPIEKILEGEVCSSLGPIEVKQMSNDVKEIFILQKVEHVKKF